MSVDSFNLLHVLLQVGTNCRVEKAEILEHTVRFLQSISKEGPARADGGDGGQTHSFQDGISTCLQRAARFLGPEGKDVWLGLDPSRFAHSDSDSSGAHRRTEGSSFSSPSNTKTILQMLKHKSNHRRQARGLKGRGFARPDGAAAERELPQVNRTQNQLPSSVETGQASKQSLAQNHPVPQTLWRPWPWLAGSPLRFSDSKTLITH